MSPAPPPAGEQTSGPKSRAAHGLEYVMAALVTAVWYWNWKEAKMQWLAAWDLFFRTPTKSLGSLLNTFTSPAWMDVEKEAYQIVEQMRPGMKLEFAFDQTGIGEGATVSPLLDQQGAVIGRRISLNGHADPARLKVLVRHELVHILREEETRQVEKKWERWGLLGRLIAWAIDEFLTISVESHLRGEGKLQLVTHAVESGAHAIAVNHERVTTDADIVTPSLPELITNKAILSNLRTARREFFGSQA